MNIGEINKKIVEYFEKNKYNYFINHIGGRIYSL
jgi:DNA-binding transcriptional regulator GbsR (MarR family)